jgi:hypothetical protein
MSYRKLVESVDGWQEMSDSQLLAACLDQTKEYIDQDRWSLLGIASIIGPQNVEPLKQFLESAGLGWAVLQAAGSGLPIGDPSLNSFLRSLGNSWCDAIAEHGRHAASICEMAGLVESVEAIQAGIAEARLAVKKEDIGRTNAARWNAFREALHKWDGTPATEPSL